jgi:spoIIIJ-associated protein
MASEKSSVDVFARTVDDAVEQGLAQLGLARDQVEVEVISAGRSGVLGIGAQDAQVRLSALPAAPSATQAGVAQEPTSGVELTEVTEPPARLEPVGEPGPAGEAALPGTQPQVAELAARLLQGLIDHMHIQGRVVVRAAEDLADDGESSPQVLDITGRDLGVLIGRQGETLQALQYLTRLMLNKSLARWEPVIVDVESYRARRRRLLRQLALRMAERAITSRRRVILEAMPAHERRIIHLTLHDHLQVTTRSIGEGEHRKVTIIPK